MMIKKIQTIVPMLAMAIFVFAGFVMAAEPNLVGRWNLNDNTSNTAKDSSGNKLDGAVSGINVVDGKFGNAYDFSSNGFVKIANNTLAEPNNVSIEAWVKSSSSPGQFKYIFAKGANGDAYASYALYTGSSGGLSFYVADNNGFYLSPDAGVGIWDGGWHHITGTYDGSFIRLYVDSAEIGSGTPHNTAITYNLPDSNDLFIGSYNGMTSHGFTGTIDEVRLWNRALTAAEIAKHATSNSSAVAPYMD
ncbi:MAG TPA: LamG domain-containing protein [Patescibacteria group bacterium]